MGQTIYLWLKLHPQSRKRYGSNERRARFELLEHSRQRWGFFPHRRRWILWEVCPPLTWFLEMRITHSFPCSMPYPLWVESKKKATPRKSSFSLERGVNPQLGTEKASPSLLLLWESEVPQNQTQTNGSEPKDCPTQWSSGAGKKGLDSTGWILSTRHY